MKKLGLLSAVTVVLAVVLGESAAWAVLDPAEQACQARAARRSRGFFQSVSRTVRRCEERTRNGALPPTTDCAVEPRTSDRVARSRSRLLASVVAACPDAVVDDLVFGGPCFGEETGGGIGDCLGETHEDGARLLLAVAFATEPVSAPQLACQNAVAKEAGRFAARRLSRLQRCKNRVAGGDLPLGTDCSADARTAAAIAAEQARAADKITGACPDLVVQTLTFGVPCAGANGGAALAACALAIHRDRTDKLLVAEYGSGATGGVAVAKQISDTSDCVGGPLSRCRGGDYLLANDQIRVVIQDVQRNLFGIGQFGGQIIDGDLVRGPADPDRDNFEEWAVSINIENTAHYTALTVLNDGSDGQAAIIRATGVDDLLDFLNPSSVVAGFGFNFPSSANDLDLPIEVMTDYILEPGRNYVRVDTVLQNTGPSPLRIFFGEFMNGSGQVELFQPAYGFGEPLVTSRCPTTATNPCNFVAWSGEDEADGVSYGYVHDVPGSSTFTTSGVTVPQLKIEIIFALIGAFDPVQLFLLQPVGDPGGGDRRTFTRHFVVGDGSVSSITDARNAIQCLPTGRLEGTVTAGGAPAVRADVVILGSVAEGPSLGPLTRNVVTHTRTDALGRYALTLPPGSYNVVANLDGHPYEGGGASPAQHPVTIAYETTVIQDVALPATGTLRVTVSDETPDPIAAKASVIGFDPSADPRNFQNILGFVQNTTGVFSELFEDGLPYGVAKSLFIDHGGDSGGVPVEPGSYQVVVSHGTEYSTATAPITVTAGATTNVDVQVARVTDTTGFISGDFHVHSIDSPDSEVSRAERVVSMLAEGVDFFTSSDHDIRTDFQSTVAALGAASLISTVPSGEITTFDYGHFNAWPMTIDAGLVNGGTVDHGGAAPAGDDFPSKGHFSLTPAQIIAAAASDPGTNTVQVNHIHSHFGLDGGSGLAIDTGLTPPESKVPAVARRLPGVGTPNYFTDTFDALEIWIGEDRGQILTNFLGQNIGDWFNLINQGIPSTGIADSDTHRRHLSQSGFPRSMVASPTDDPGALGAIADTLSANVNEGRVIGTNGPMVRVTAFAASTGETAGLELGLPLEIGTTDGAVDITVEIQSPVWAEFDRVEYYVNPTTTKSTSSKQSGAGPVTVARYGITPDFVQTKDTHFAVSTTTVNGAIPGAQRLDATTTLSLGGLTEDIWVVVLVKGTDGTSRPLFPVIPNSLKTSTNTTLAQLTDGNLGEDGVLALAFTNPLRIDVDGGGWTPPGVQVSNP